jgi:perosamine synthetase
MELSNLIIRENAHLKEGLEKLNINGLGTLFVIGEDETLNGIVTDGDIRRALLNNFSLNDRIGKLMNRNFVSLPCDTDNVRILETLNDRIKLVPLVDESGKLVDYASIHRIRKIMIASPVLNGNELAYVTDCVKTNWISSQGKYVRKFESQFSEYHNGFHALAVSNGTVALHLALLALGIGKGDEVIVPDLTFAASVNAILYTGATPVLVDIDPVTWTLDLQKAEGSITERTKGIMPVHLYGHPCDMDATMVLASKYNLYVIEDCAEALGSFYKDLPVGVFGDAATFSFFGNKTITTGEGGMVLFKDPAMAARAAILRDHGMQKDKRYWHIEVGYNYRMTNLQAAVGVAQFERLHEFVTAKRKIAAVYTDALKPIPYFILPAEMEHTVNSFWLYTLLIRPDSPFSREDVISFLYLNGIETRPVFYCMHEMPPYQSFGESKSLAVSKGVSTSGLSLPSSVNLSEVELTHVCNIIKQFLQKYLNK